jgi:hypothetical protein
MRQAVRQLTHADEGLLGPAYVPICDRDSKMEPRRPPCFAGCGRLVVVTPIRAPNASAYAERFIRSIKEECLNRLIPIGETYFRRAVGILARRLKFSPQELDARWTLAFFVGSGIVRRHARKYARHVSKNSRPCSYTSRNGRAWFAGFIGASVQGRKPLFGNSRTR